MTTAATVAGIWDLSIATPIGRIGAVIELRDDDGTLTGTARGAGEEVDLDGLALTGDRLTWKQAITRPMRLNLAFDVTVTGDTLAGTSRAGRLPASRVSGLRRTDRAAEPGPAEADPGSAGVAEPDAVGPDAVGVDGGLSRGASGRTP